MSDERGRACEMDGSDLEMTLGDSTEGREMREPSDGAALLM